MTFTIPAADSADALGLCAPLSISCNNWGSAYAPEAEARLLYVRDSGFALSLRCREADPCRTYTRENDPVYQDSAMEAFFNFFPELPGSGYVNFEMNANGAMLSQYGAGRGGRRFLASLGFQAPKCSASVREDFWELSLFIPLDLIYEIYGLSESRPQISDIRCNFYKIKESQPQEHYLSFAPIDAPAPDFHRPEFFAEGVICDE